MVRCSAPSSVLLGFVLHISFIFPLTAAAQETRMEFQHMSGDYVEHRVDEEEARAVASALQPELSEYDQCN
jgi:hypothetical protein